MSSAVQSHIFEALSLSEKFFTEGTDQSNWVTISHLYKMTHSPATSLVASCWERAGPSLSFRTTLILHGTDSTSC